MRTLTAAAAAFVLLGSAPAIADPVHDALDAYALYQNDVSALLDTNVDSGRTVDAALARLSRHNPRSVARGWIAYGALTAARAPLFAASVERRIHDDGRSTVLRRLRDDPTYARRQQNGSDQAIQLILSAASADGARAGLAGVRYDRFARTASHVQLVSSVLRADFGPTRLTPEMLARLHVGAAAGRPTNDVNALGGRGFWDSLAGRDVRPTGAHGGREQRLYAPVTDRMLTLAALVTARAENSERARVNALLDEPITRHCMEMHQLELRQCLSVSVDSGERAYCLGRHALTGPGACVSAMTH